MNCKTEFGVNGLLSQVTIRNEFQTEGKFHSSIYFVVYLVREAS